MNNDIYIIRHHNNITTTSGTTSGTTSIYDTLSLMLFINTLNIQRLPEKGFSGRPILFSLKNFNVSVSSLGGNCEATGEALVNSLPGAFSGYTATLNTPNQLNINTLRRGAFNLWEQIKINFNVKH